MWFKLIFVLTGLSPTTMRIQTALIYDGLLLLTDAFKQLNVEHLKPKRLVCHNYTTWEHGNSITNFMRNVYPL